MMIRALIGGVAGGIAMFIVGFVFWATPLASIGYSTAGEAQSAAIQQSLAANLTHTGRYVVPDTGTSGGTVLYGRGPVATVDYNTHGYPATDQAALIGGVIHDIVVGLMIAAALFAISHRVTEFGSRLRLAFGLSAAAAVLTGFRDPISFHADWRFGIYAFIVALLMLGTASFVIVRWFLPTASAQP